MRVPIIALCLPAILPSATWRGLVIAEENRCSDYAAGDYRYSRAIENAVVDSLGGVYSPDSGVWYAS